MAEKNWHAGSTLLIVKAAVCLACVVAPARAYALSNQLAAPNHFGRLALWV